MSNRGGTFTLDEHLSRMLQEAVRQEVAPLRAEICTLREALKDSQAQKPYLTVDEAAELARCHSQTIRQRISKGQLKAKHVGNRVLVSRTDLDDFLSD